MIRRHEDRDIRVERVRHVSELIMSETQMKKKDTKEEKEQEKVGALVYKKVGESHGQASIRRNR